MLSLRVYALWDKQKRILYLSVLSALFFTSILLLTLRSVLAASSSCYSVYSD